MTVQKLRQKRLRVSDFALLLVVFEVTYRSEGVNSRENKAVSTVTLCLALPASDITNMVYCMVSNLVSYAQSTVTMVCICGRSLYYITSQLFFLLSAFQVIVWLGLVQEVLL